MRTKFFFVLALLVMALFLNQVSASYITGNVYLDENGNAEFDVDTDQAVDLPGTTFENNHLSGTTNQLLTLKGGIWTLDISLEEYDDIFLEIHLPKNLVSIKSVQGSDNIIDIEEKTVTIADSRKLEFTMSYILKKQKDYSWAYWLAAMVLLFCGFLAYKKATKRRERFENILPIISDKEQQIVDVLMKRPMRQKELRSHLNVPKASFSRYMVNLEKKKLIVREGEGKNKLVKLK